MSDFIPPETNRPQQECPNAERARHLRTGIAGPYVPAPRRPTMTAFGNVAVGTRIRLENCYGVKIDPISDPQSEAFYASHGREFHGWNFRYQFMGHGDYGMFSLAPDCEVEVLGDA